ncbi:hypothetical protein F1654_10735 [Alkalicaulis satelles]|uniref:Uncharacterized protein n=1 Tax=Alkalicaulis satelles TaxID=2609175 RepID=A0A5M6ZEW8_9PROT|nr:hypothetical protein [Alkalicaulis satelles]KAA5802297.1 hypothetical protein F1654_10735 [Alkalicaulis satelles]
MNLRQIVQSLLGLVIFALSVIAAGALTTQHLARETAKSICAQNGVHTVDTSPLGLTIECRSPEDAGR